jgi:hypothetical protein
VLLRVFFTVLTDRVVLLFQVHNKGGDPSEKRQWAVLTLTIHVLKHILDHDPPRR